METTNRDDYRQWLVHPLTKAVLVRLEVDEEIFKEEWLHGRYDNAEHSANARGRAFYAKSLAADIRTMKNSDQENMYQEAMSGR